MANKSIKYTARDYDSIRNELISFSKQYYPELSDNFNDSSVGSWLIDLMSAVGDDLSYHTDRMYQETQLDSANMKSSLLNIARTNGVKVPGSKASVCEVELSCVIPTLNENNMALPNWDLAPIVKMSSTIGNGDYTFSLTENVNFGEQFNEEGISNRKYEPNRNANNVITSYTVYKTSVCVSGQRKIYKKVISDNELQPFMEVIIPEQNVMNIEGIIFKENSNINSSPELYEFFMDEESFRFHNESINTYKYFEVNSLSDQYRFGEDTTLNDGSVIKNVNYPSNYVDYTETTSFNTVKTTRYYKGKWKPVLQKYITEYTDNGYLKIIFGSGTEFQETPNSGTTFGQYRMSQMVNNAQLGILPKAGWTMFVLYNVGGGTNTNLGIGAINTFANKDASFNSIKSNEVDPITRSQILNSISVRNITPSIGGKDAPSSEELKYLIKYNNGSQERCVTLKDYKARLMEMPSKFGCPFRMNAIEENNKIVIPMLGLDADGHLTTYLHSTLVDNMVEYLSHYKSINDYVEFKSGNIFNIGVSIDVFIDKNYTTNDVVGKVIDTVASYMDVNKHDMGGEIFIGDLEKEINSLDGVVALIDLRVYNIYGGSQYNSQSNLPMKKDYSASCNGAYTTAFVTPDDANSYEVDLSAVDYVLTNNSDSMYEILNPDADIQVRIKLK